MTEQEFPSRLLLEDPKPALLVVRNCCTSGCCLSCSKYWHANNVAFDRKPKVRVLQFITFCRPMAEKVKQNFAGYGPEIVEATEEEIAKLEASSAEYVRERLLKPEHINNKVF